MLSKDAITDVYRKRAGNYDFTANLYYLIGFREYAYRRLAIEALHLKKGDTVIDIGCGTGLNFARIEQQIGTEGKLIGVDLTDRMLAQARTRIVRNGWSNVELSQTDAAAYVYDHSLMHNDFHPYYVRVGDRWTKIDYSQHPSTWMKPLQRGQETDLIEIPANWYLDDLPPMLFIKKAPNSHGFVNPRHLEESWRDQFDWVYRENDYAVFAMTIHPDVSGRPQVLLMLERLIEYIRGHEGTRFVTFDEIANDFKERFRRQTR
jgi:SAM-dependent methyltransferase